MFIAPATKPIPINLINIFYGKSNITNTGELNIYVAKIQIIPYFIDYSGSIKIYFPYNAVNYLNFSPITCELVICTNNETNCLQYPRECNFSTYSSLNSINYVQIFDICKDKNCLSEVMLRITNLRSPISLKPLDNLNSTNFYGGQCLTLDNKIISFSTQTDVPKIVLLALPFQNIVLNISDSTTSHSFLINSAQILIFLNL